nr:hypothetical protein [Tanacetum cinerariifolium]
KTGVGYDSQLTERDLSNKSDVFESAYDSSVNESKEDNNNKNDRYKACEGYHAVPLPYTGNFMPPRPDLYFVRLDDSFFKSAICEPITSVHETETSTSKISKERKSVLNNKGKATGQKEVRPVWNNTKRVNHQNFPNNLSHPHPRRNFVPTAVITNSSKVQVNDAKQSSPRVAVSTSTARYGNPQYTLKYQGIFNSRCFRDLMGNKSFHTDYQEIDGGFVAFGGSPKGGKISGKGTIRIGKLDFEDIYFVKELKFNLFSVSQMCDKKNNVLFTETKCLVLSSDFKLPNENQILLKMKGIKREFSVARTPQQNGVAKRKNKTLIEAARTVLADLLLPTTFWVEAVNTAWCHVTLLNTLDHLGKFEAKADEGFLVGYSINIKAFRVFNSRTRRVKENLHIKFLENKPNVTGRGLEWLFYIDSLTYSMNSEPVTERNQTNNDADDKDAGDVPNKGYKGVSKGSNIDDQEKTDSITQNVGTVELSINTTSTNINTGSLNINIVGPNDPSMQSLEEIGIFDDVYDDREVGAEADTNNLELLTVVSPIPTTRVHKDHPKEHIIGDLNLATQTRRMLNFSKENYMVSYINKKRRTNHKDYKNCLFSYFLSQQEPKKVIKDLANPSWIEAIKDRSNQDLFSLVPFMGFIVYQMDVKSAFLNGTIEEDVLLEPGNTQQVVVNFLEAFSNNDYARAILDRKYTTDLTFWLLALDYLISEGVFDMVWRFEDGISAEFRVTYNEIQVNVVGLTYYGTNTFFPTMLAIQAEECEGSVHPSKPQPPSSSAQAIHATTTAASLDAAQDSGGSIAQTMSKRVPTPPYDSPLLRVNALGSDEGNLRQKKIVYGTTYTKLIMKGRIIENIDQDTRITLVTPTKASSQEDQPEDHLGVLSAAKVLAEEAKKKVNTILEEGEQLVLAVNELVLLVGYLVLLKNQLVLLVNQCQLVLLMWYQEGVKDKEQEELLASVTTEDEANPSVTNVDWDDVQAQIQADEELAQKILKEERESLEEEKKDAKDLGNKDSKIPSIEEPKVNQEEKDSVNSANRVNAVSSIINAANNEVNAVGRKLSIKLPDDLNMPDLEDISILEDSNEDVFVVRIEAIRLFIAYASFKDFVVYQMDTKSAFLYRKIEEEVYVYQPPGFKDPDFPNKVYKVEKVLYGLQQASRAWLILWQCKKHNVVANSIIEAKEGCLEWNGKVAQDKIGTSAHNVNLSAVKVNTLGSGEDRLKLKELMELYTKLSDMVLNLETTKTAQAKEIVNLKKKVKRLEKKRQSRTHELKRLYKDLQGEEVVVKEVNAVSIATSVTTAATTDFSFNELTLAQALMEIKTSKPKAKGIVIQEPSDATTTTTTIIPLIKSQDKGKGIMVEPDIPMMKKAQINLDEEFSFKLQAKENEQERILREKAQQIEKVNLAWDDVQAKIKADYEMAQRLQAEEQE